MNLESDNSENLKIKGHKTTIEIGQYEMEMTDFWQLVLYALSVSDCIGPEDPRHLLVHKIKKAKLVRGHNPNLLRYEVQS